MLQVYIIVSWLTSLVLTVVNIYCPDSPMMRGSSTLKFSIFTRLWSRLLSIKVLFLQLWECYSEHQKRVTSNVTLKVRITMKTVLNFVSETIQTFYHQKLQFCLIMHQKPSRGRAWNKILVRELREGGE